jgi:hypothetical protein
MVIWGYGGGSADGVAIPETGTVTEDEPQLIDLNTEPRVLTDGEGELALKILWSYVGDLLQ